MFMMDLDVTLKVWVWYKSKTTKSIHKKHLQVTKMRKTWQKVSKTTDSRLKKRIIRKKKILVLLKSTPVTKRRGKKRKEM